MKKSIPNILSFSRIIFSICLIFSETFSIPFFVLYTLGGITDVLDGFLARKFGGCSEFGSRIDSVADLFFFFISLVKVFIAIATPMWLLNCLMIIAFFKIVLFILALIINHKLVFFHTVLNKITGFMIFVVPYLLLFWDINYVAIPVTLIAFVAVVQEGFVISKNFEK